jgi:uncharacterized FlaG/YvyC family protein
MITHKAFGTFILAASLCAPCLLRSQTVSKPVTVSPPAKPQRLVQIATLNTVEANREFQANVQVLQAQRQAAIELNATMGKEKDAKKKKEVQAQLDSLMAKLNENNDKMRKAYGFSLDRNYTLVIEKAHIYMFVTDEEAAKYEQAQAATAAKK